MNAETPRNPSDTEAATGTDPGGATPSARRAQVPPFDVRGLRRELRRDAAVRWMVALALGSCLLAGLVLEQSSLWAAGVLVVLALLAWLWLSAVSAKVWQGLHQVTPLVAAEPERAEDWLARHLRRLPLHRPVRLLLYHRLAMLRHRQQRFAESGAICQHLLAYRLGPAERVRPHLLLLMVESRLAENDACGAYLGLLQLHATPLSLIESLQYLALRTRYQLAVGYNELALAGLKHKLELAELMPAPQCGVLHAMLAVAATRSRHEALADWLQRRAELICGAEWLEEFAQTIGFLDAPEPGRSA